MKAKIMMGAFAVSAAALVGCGSDVAGGPHGSSGNQPGNGNDKTTGTVEFNLDLPNGETTDTIDLHLECPGVSQDHVLDVIDGEVRAAFGGLTPGMCTATLQTQTAQGTDCEGMATFMVTEGTVTPVTVVLTCQGYGGDMGGTVVIDTDFEIENCDADRILKVYAIPANVLTGESTTVEVETQPGSIVGTASYSWTVVNDATNTATGALSMSASCAAGSAACQDLLCQTLGSTPTNDPETMLPTDGLWVQVTLEDDECRDSERVLVDCVQASVCGDGTEEGAEQCDDGNTANNDGCSSTCRDEVCGDGILQTGEQCDGLNNPPLGPNESCSATCQIVVGAFCGDNMINGSEQCDGTDTPAGRVCSATCMFVPTCGNNFVEGTEECDDGNLVDGDGCESDCTDTPAGDPEGPCRTCVTTGPIAADYTNDFCATSSDPLCAAVLECYVASTCFATAASITDCYCGIGADTNQCLMATYVPTGPCATAMRNAASNGGPQVPNDVVVNNMFDINTYGSLGWAGQIMLEAQNACPMECHFTP